ncbi:hypothetical protein F7725_013158 [Dissostichus mawsoni]|uniref:Acetoacetyl-CoA synthetase n=1 Tax=Dissostichus mawsoni TaxID=36200 RepID=A0A7J5YPG1_DISMA|nr:hypothetical protein F7725_013158 [Dissostichus mawsoni]
MSRDTEGKSEKIMDMESKVLWYPDSKKNTQMDTFRIQVNKDYGLNLANYNDLYQWSVDSYPDFWSEVWRFCGVVSSKPYEEVVDVSKRVSDVPEWFKGARLNYAENLLKHADQDKVALYAASYLPNGIHAVEGMLAAASIGAIWSSTSVDFGVNGVLDRFSQIQPKLIFSVAAVVYNGKTHDHMEKLTSVVKGLPDLKKVVVVPYARSKHEIDLSKIPNSVFIDDFLASGRGGEAEHFPQLEFEQLPFNHPLFIMYSSGTTGAPKCMVHSAGGTLIQHLKEHILHGNMTSSDVIIYYTTTGWMMWNWLMSALAVGASVVLYDGSPLIPHPMYCGTSRTSWAETHNLQSLHTILSTGSPLKPQSYDYVYRCIKSNVLLGSISGGTDIVSCFMGQNPTVPVYRGEIQTRNLGIAVEAWSPDGKPVWGESGELVCLKPIPCQPTHFWNDENRSKYHKAYFSTYPDYCKINPKTGGIVMLGRSDGTLNPNGVRFGSSEIYNIVEAFEEVTDSLCVPQYNNDGEERVILFLKMASGKPFCPELVGKIKGAIRKALSARHVPALMLETRDIPYTISGKNGGGRETGDCWPGGGAKRSFLQPRFTGSLQEHS